MQRIFLDHLNGAPQFGNPSSLHTEGRHAAALRDKAREKVAALVGARPEEVVFTSSGTESNLWALQGLAPLSKAKHLVVSAVEHPSILEQARRMEKLGWAVTRVAVDRYGQVVPDQVEQAIGPDTALVSIQWANPEVGTIQPIEEITRLVKARGLLFHCDAVAAAGQVPIDWKALPMDSLSLAANSFGGPPGIGALVLRKGIKISSLFVGGAQEAGRRSGTENLPGIIQMGEAAASAARNLPQIQNQLPPLRDRLIRGILMSVGASLNGHPTHRLSGHVSVSIPGTDAEALVLTLDREGVSVGLGSACVSQAMKGSHVLRAMGVEEKLALGTLVFTLGLELGNEEIDRVLEKLPRAVAWIKQEVGA